MEIWATCCVATEMAEPLNRRDVVTVRFIHTSDWQLGIRPYYLDDRAAELFAESRFEAVRQIGHVAKAEHCDCVLVAGDVFTSNHVDRRTVARAVDAMNAIPVPIYLLPGNHDPLDPSSVYRSAAFLSRRSKNVHVLDSPGLLDLKADVELVAAPWFTKRPVTDLVADACGGLTPATGLRIVIGHGIVDSTSPTADSPSLIRLQPLMEALSDGRVHFVALGDRHSVTPLSDRAWYSGAPEATDHGEEHPGYVLLVDLDESGRCSVEERPIGRWHFVRGQFDLASEHDVREVRDWLERLPDKGRTIVKLGLTGTLPVKAKALLDQLLLEEHELFAAIEWWDLKSDLAILPDDGDVGNLELSGFARDAWERLREEVQVGAADSEIAMDSLALLYRLSGGSQ